MDVILTAAITSLVTTVVAMSVKGGVGWLATRRASADHPLTLVRNATTGFTLVNESAWSMVELTGHAYGPGSTYNALVSSAGLVPGAPLYLPDIANDANVFFTWREARGRRVSPTVYAEALKIGENVDRYSPKRITSPPPEWGG